MTPIFQKGSEAFVLGISVRYKERVSIVLRRNTRRSQNNPSGAKCSRVGGLRLEAGTPADLGLQKGGHSAALGMIRRGRKRRGGQDVSV